MRIGGSALNRTLRQNGGQGSASLFCKQGLDQRIRCASPTVAGTELLCGETRCDDENRRGSTEPAGRLAVQTGVQSSRQRAAVSSESADWS